MMPLMHLRRLQAAISDWLQPTVTVSGIKFVCPTPICVWRAWTLKTKEPETIEWIGRMEEGDVLYDIGANVGTYSLYAAALGLKVVAFEPGAANYAALNRNIEANRMWHRITAYPIALSNTIQMQSLSMADTSSGMALHRITPNGGAGFNQGVFVLIGDARYGNPFPNHIKIDVDGAENDILEGMSETLHDHRLKSVMVELSDEDYVIAGPLMKDSGFTLRERRQSPMFKGTQYAKYWNYFFERVA